MQDEQKKRFLLSGAYYLALTAALFLFFRYLFWWLLPFLIALAAAGAMEPIILRLQRTLHFKRSFSAAVLTLFLLFLLGGLLSLLLSALFSQATAFLTRLPSLLDTLPAKSEELLARLYAYGALCPARLRELLSALLSDWTGSLSAALKSLVPHLLAALGSLAAALPGLLLAAATTLLAIFFTSASYPALCAALNTRLSSAQRSRLLRWRSGVTCTLARWLRAQALLCLLTFCQLLVGLRLLGAFFPLLAAFLITLVDALPVFGTGTVLVPWALAELLFGSAPRGIALALLYLCTLTVRSIAEPKLVTAHTKLPPVASLAAMYLGFRAFGVGGMILLPLLLLLTSQVWRAEQKPPSQGT